MISIFWILAGMMAYGLLHSFLASHFFKNAVRRTLGEGAFQRYYRLFYNVMGVITLLPVLALPFLLPDQPLYALRGPWRWLFLAGQGISALLVAATVVQTGALDFLGLRQLAMRESKDQELVVSGFYRWMRHPLYFFSILFFWLSPTMTWNLAALYAGATLYFIVGAIFEERKLEAHFGEAYRRYKARTPMIVPGLRRQ
jgi:protein-S-isoprenylcysteine O-methyltransferase Ste14